MNVTCPNVFFALLHFHCDSGVHSIALSGANGEVVQVVESSI